MKIHYIYFQTHLAEVKKNQTEKRKTMSIVTSGRLYKQPDTVCGVEFFFIFLEYSIKYQRQYEIDTTTFTNEKRMWFIYFFYIILFCY